MSILSGALHAISDHGNALASKSIVLFGYVFMGVGVGGGVANDTAAKVVNDVAFGLPDWAAVVAIISGLSLIIKNSVDTYYNIKDRRNKAKK